MKGLRIAGARTIEEANRYLEEEFLPWWNQHLVVAGEPGRRAPALGTRQVENDYTVRLDGRIYRIVMDAAPTGLRGAVVRIEQRLEAS